MKRLLLFSALVASPLIARAGEITISYLTPASAASSLSIETIGSTQTGSNITSSSMSFTCTGNTKLLEVPISFRRNNGQSVTGATWTDGITTYNLILSTTNPSSSFRNIIYYLQNPTAGTGNIVITLSPATPAFAMTAISFKGTSSAPHNEGSNTTVSVVTSSATSTTIVNDYLVDLMVKQDFSSSTPILNTPDAVLFQNFTFGLTGGDGGYFEAAYFKATTTSSTINYSWTTAANHANTWNVVTP